MRRPTRRPIAKATFASLIAAAFVVAAPAASAQAPATEDGLRAAIAAQVAQGPSASGAYVVDLSDGHVVFEDRAEKRLLSASVIKLYTTARR